MLIFIKLKKFLNICLLILSIFSIPIFFVNGIFEICNSARSYIISKREPKESKITSKITQINRGETKLIFEDALLQITIDNILIIDGTNLYRVSGKINDGILTSPFDNTQGESFQFVRFIIQINRIASDYAEFRVSFTNNY